METVYFGSYFDGGPWHAIHISKDNNSTLHVVTEVAFTTDHCSPVPPKNIQEIELARKGQRIGFKVHVPEPDYSDMPYDISEEEFFRRTKMVQPSPTPDGGITWNIGDLGLFQHEGKPTPPCEWDTRPYSDVKCGDGSIFRAKWTMERNIYDPQSTGLQSCVLQYFHVPKYIAEDCVCRYYGQQIEFSRRAEKCAVRKLEEDLRAAGLLIEEEN